MRAPSARPKEEAAWPPDARRGPDEVVTAPGATGAGLVRVRAQGELQLHLEGLQSPKSNNLIFAVDLAREVVCWRSQAVSRVTAWWPQRDLQPRGQFLHFPCRAWRSRLR